MRRHRPEGTPAGPLAALPTLLVLLALLTAAVLAGLALAGPAPPARAQVGPAQVVQSLSENRVYTAPAVSDALTASERDSIRAALREADTPVYLAILSPAQLSSDSELRSFAQQVVSGFDGDATVLVAAGGDYEARSTVLGDQAETAADLANAAHPDDSVAFARDFPTRVQAALEGELVEQTEPTPTGAGGVPWGGLALLVLVLGGGGLYYGVSRRRRSLAEARDLERVRPAAEEDVTRLGEDITTLDRDVERLGMAEETRADYQHALDSYEDAKRRLAAARRAADLRPVSSSLEDGRYAMTCVRARLAGEAPPERRAPCFFNPQHGPSVTDLEWTPPGGVPREVPVCDADAERLREGAEPDTRQVEIGGQRRPYWEAGPAYAPWFGGYYGGFGMGGLLPGMLIGTMLGSSLGGYDGGTGGDVGGGDVGGGGGDFGGFGGGDLGGLGGGGGDFGGF